MVESPTAAAVGTASSTLPVSYQTTSDVAVTVAIGDEGCSLGAVFHHQGAQVEHLHKMRKKKGKK